ncbi:DUF885 domain-containing protein [Hymenobacter sp. BT770]|uniref:DUF885 domain-containing protein n=1 Tax=Hymenobacter sp. BT770 TaxID=2886942 RepID=UPI001D0FC4B7|nr:DUF885 domain-containing protein [Hymenobacter sp. BT770]MCC3152448.1 DUF885 domain-containing protein [Hymenobacter sp. BT770]MDO3414576.1 DUF885 domain-containing protein [Hymenobacter sp. BT770]
MKLRYLPLLALAVASCSHADKPAATAAPDARFDAFKNQFIEALWRQNPDFASSQGYHKYDSLLVIPDAAQRQRDAAFMQQYLAALGKFSLDSLSPNNQIDLRLLRNELRAERWYADTLQNWQWNPAGYNLGATVGDLLNGRYFPLDRRLRNISDKISHASEFYTAARANLSNPTREHTQLAIKQNTGGLAVFGSALADSVQKSGLSAAEKKTLTDRIATTRQAVQGYLDFLQKQVLPAGKFRSFRIGKDLFDQKFAYDIQSHFTAAEIYQQALKHKAELLHDMGHRAARLYPKYFPGQKAPADTLALITAVVNQLTLKHAPREGFVDAVKRQIPTLVAFVNEHKLLTQDPSKPLVVRETPLYMRGSGAGASVSAPGPYDKGANTYYNVEPIPAEWTPAQAESYLREYNDYTLQILNIHEAIPGHYTQLVYANRSPSLVKSIFGNGAMVEGWAVYAERMMLENGYGNNSDEMWLLWDKWNMRVTLNTIIDRAIQVNNMSENDVVTMLRRDGFQEEAEARGKWLRATLSQVQLSSYFSGYTEIYALREELKKKKGKDFNLKAFHEEFLSYGSAPVKYIRELMLRK